MKDSENDIEQLTEIFRALGATDADAWASSQIEEDIPQLALYLFLKLAVAPISQLDSMRALRDILRGVGSREGLEAVRRLATSPQATKDLLHIVRSVLCEYLTRMTFLLDDTAGRRFSGWPFEQTLERVHWELFQTENGKPVARLGGLHEVVDEFFSEIVGNTQEEA